MGRVAREVQDQCLVHLDLDVEHVAELIDPVVEVHDDSLGRTSRLCNTNRKMSSWTGRSTVHELTQREQVVPRVDIVGLSTDGRDLSQPEP